MPTIIRRRNGKIISVLPKIQKQSCDQCAANVINGVYCHEFGCPTDRREREAARRAKSDCIDDESLEASGEVFDRVVNI